MFSWIRNLRTNPPQEQVREIEQREPSIEQRLERILAGSRSMRSQSDSDLKDLVEDIDAVLSILESALNILDAGDLHERAKSLRTRLRKARTRATRARAA